jgi:hypothetical protein
MTSAKWKHQRPEDRNAALQLTNEWLEDVCTHVAAWESTDQSDSFRRTLPALLRRILGSCKAASDLAQVEQYEQAGALLRVAIEPLWLIDLSVSDHPQAQKALKDWTDGKQMKPSEVRNLLAEEFGAGDASEADRYLKFSNAAYGELCGFIHPQTTAPTASALERGLLVVVMTVLGCVPPALSACEIKIPAELRRRGDILCAKVPLLLTAHLPDEVRAMAIDFASAIIAAAAEADYGED